MGILEKMKLCARVNTHKGIKEQTFVCQVSNSLGTIYLGKKKVKLIRLISGKPKEAAVNSWKAQSQLFGPIPLTSPHPIPQPGVKADQWNRERNVTPWTLFSELRLPLQSWTWGKTSWPTLLVWGRASSPHFRESHILVSMPGPGLSGQREFCGRGQVSLLVESRGLRLMRPDPREGPVSHAWLGWKEELKRRENGPCWVWGGKYKKMQISVRWEWLPPPHRWGLRLHMCRVHVTVRREQVPCCFPSHSA